MFGLAKIAGRWFDYAKHPDRYARHGTVLMPRIAGAAFTELDLSLIAYAAGVDAKVEVGIVPEDEADKAWSVVGASIVAPVLMTGVTATAVTFTLGYSRAGAAVVPIATLVLNTGVNLAVDTEVQMALLAAAAGLQAGDVITLVTTHASTGIAVPAGTTVKVELQ
jgi:hypothetical protein